jgi:hypothetical protein
LVVVCKESDAVTGDRGQGNGINFNFPRHMFGVADCHVKHIFDKVTISFLQTPEHLASYTSKQDHQMNMYFYLALLPSS